MAHAKYQSWSLLIEPSGQTFLKSCSDARSMLVLFKKKVCSTHTARTLEMKTLESRLCGHPAGMNLHVHLYAISREPVFTPH